LPNFGALPDSRPNCLMLAPDLAEPASSAASMIETVEGALVHARDYEKEKDFA
jgi:hypothetical protein